MLFNQPGLILNCSVLFLPTVTEKGYESESYSETEDFKPTKQAPAPAKPPANKQEEKKSQKKTSAITNKGGKQASIMGFFQKK